MDESRNIIIITGRSAVGKTIAANYLRDQFALRGVPCEDKVISDAFCLFKALQDDDEQGGLHHTHEWCETLKAGHSHSQLEPPLPFKVLDNTLPDTMLRNFFTELTNIPSTNKIYIAEWAAGASSVNSKEIDYSYKKVKRMLQEKILADGWLAHVQLVIHLMTTDENRLLFNSKRHIPSLEKILDGAASWKTQREVLEFYQDDDFFEIREFFSQKQISIHDLTNDGSNSFFEKKLDKIINELLLVNASSV
jgi:hypothetical protein